MVGVLIMPRWPVRLAIVAFWLAVTGWLIARDVWPALRTGEAPPFTIDLADEAQIHAIRTRWVILRGEGATEKKIGRARTWVKYLAADDTFEMNEELEELTLSKGLVTVKVPRMLSTYRVTPEGDLRAMSVQLLAAVRVFPGLMTLDLAASVSGEVRDGQYWPTCRIESAAWGKLNPEMQPVPVARHGAVLNPLHPVNRIAGLRPGQRWRMPIVDPLSDALSAKANEFLPAAPPGPRSLDAEVLPEEHILVWEGKEIPCLVIQYRGDDVTARTWVRRRDGLVVRQEAVQLGERVVLQRESVNP